MEVGMDSGDEDEDHDGDNEMDRAFEAPADPTPALLLAATDMEVGEVFMDGISSMVPQDVFTPFVGAEVMVPDMSLELGRTWLYLLRLSPR
jgi:hypothetical protein